MAAPDLPPVLTVAGTVVRQTDRTFTDPKTAEVRPDRSFIVRTDLGFCKVKVTDGSPLPELNSKVSLPVEVYAWQNERGYGVGFRRVG